MNNIFDKAYQSNLSRLKYFEEWSASPNGHLGIYNMGRNSIVKLIMPFFNADQTATGSWLNKKAFGVNRGGTEKVF